MRDVPISTKKSKSLGAQQNKNDEENFGTERRDWAKTFLSNGGFDYILQ